MDIAATHPNFDAVGELLCILHAPDRMASMDDLVADLGMTESEIKSLVETAHMHGVGIHLSNKCGYRWVSFDPTGYAAAEAKALAYWQSVYGEVQA